MHEGLEHLMLRAELSSELTAWHSSPGDSSALGRRLCKRGSGKCLLCRQIGISGLGGSSKPCRSGSSFYGQGKETPKWELSLPTWELVVVEEPPLGSLSSPVLAHGGMDGQGTECWTRDRVGCAALSSGVIFPGLPPWRGCTFWKH